MNGGIGYWADGLGAGAPGPIEYRDGAGGDPAERGDCRQGAAEQPELDWDAAIAFIQRSRISGVEQGEVCEHESR